MMLKYAPQSLDEKFSLVYFRMTHDNCWSRITEKYDVMIHTLKLLPYKDRDVIYGLFELKVKGKHTLRDFIRDLNRSGTIKKLTGLSISELKGNVYVIDLYETYSGMIQGKLNDYNSIFDFDLVKHGIEEKYAVIPSENVNELKGELQSMGNLYEFRAKYFPNFYEVLTPFFNFTPIEVQIMLEAYNLGYYDIPRRSGIREIAEYFGLSKSTVQEYIRSAESKTMSNMKLFRMLNELKRL
ncbi:helix-turn-helix domain-containing protein [Thermoplasma sp.]|uniref:helix-turn-helix domain-containing protein n=1 Tax=Thermoplasma sp. TaxID=1973142 RepID=UPI00127A4DB6|nr:helix-turn-helix domain-containing protein [Thermoplasma sp.]KAA8922176.1 MAG: DNA-binding protein [Thermoplasma sp.]